MNIGIHCNHLGFLCHQEKTFCLPRVASATRFEIQDMNVNAQEVMGAPETWKAVYTGQLALQETQLGPYLIGDFSSLSRPGLYRVVVPELGVSSYQFMISDGVHDHLPFLFLDFMHNWRSGPFENAYRGPSHLDDGIRSDTGEPMDAVGGWYDAGDLRKWMVHTNLPAIGMLDLVEQLGLHRSHFQAERGLPNDFVTESLWAIDFILKMQDPDTGMLYEDVGGGGGGRTKPGMKWWYENHAGCTADNSENRFTDNVPASGDERRVRIQYNPIVQYTNTYILLRAVGALGNDLPGLRARSLEAAKGCWAFMQTKQTDGYHGWTSVRAWRLLAALACFQHDLVERGVVMAHARSLLALFDHDDGWWYMDADRTDMYRGISHAAQPLIAIGRCLQSGVFEGEPIKEEVENTLRQCLLAYALPLSQTNPFGFVPYGTFFEPATDQDAYRSFKEHLLFRFFMPNHSFQAINHGLAGHWTSWAHALALMGEVLNEPTAEALAWKQLHWLLGNNPVDVSFVSGIGYRNPMPHSRFLGTQLGGFMNGFVGSTEDQPVVDLDGQAAWNSTEYWNTPLSNTLMALAVLLKGKGSQKLGAVFSDS